MTFRASGVTAALLSALLFGASTPLAKLLLSGVEPWLLAGLLYLGAGIGLGVIGLFRRGNVQALTKQDCFWLAMATLTGGIVGPVLLMFGLISTSGASASLLLNAESVFTALLAWVVFRENFDRRILLGMIAIVAGAAILSWRGLADVDTLWPSISVLGACLCWGLDNNLTRKVSLSDAQKITAIKCLVAGSTNVSIAFAFGAQLPAIEHFFAASVVGFFGYGVSLVLFVLALRDLGTARTSTYFSTAPFVGALIAIPLLSEPLTIELSFAGALMALGIWLHLTERHVHSHAHKPMAHSHSHVHDEHHDHLHDPMPDGPHAHWHEHKFIQHKHPHYPDAHHRHEH